jgi:hypothetical protein
MARLRARTYAHLIGIGTPILLAGVLWWFRRQGGPAAPSDQLFALVVGAAMLGTAGILLKRSLPTLAASLALLVLGFPQEILGSVILPSGGLYLIAAFIVGLTDVGEMVGEGIEAGREGMEESGMNAPEMPSAFQDATDGGETEPADTPAQEVPDAEAPEGPAQPVDAADVEPITAGDEADADDHTDAEDDTDAGDHTDDDETTPDPEEVVEEHGPHHAPEVQVDQNRLHADDPSVGRRDGGDAAETVADDGPSEATDDADASPPPDAEAAERADTDEHAEADGDADAAETAAEADEETATGTPVERPGGVETLDDPTEGHDADGGSPGDDPATGDDADGGSPGDGPDEHAAADDGDDEPDGDTDETQDANASDGRSS